MRAPAVIGGARSFFQSDGMPIERPPASREWPRRCRCPPTMIASSLSPRAETRSPIAAMTRISAALALVLVVLAACAAKTDIGQTCDMTKPNANGGVSPVPDSAVSNNTLDYVSLGSTVCDDMICLRSRGDGNPASVNGNARGSCTAACLSDKDCSPDYQGNSGTYTCAALFMDQNFLAAYKAADPDGYNQLFGSNASAKYCVRAQ